MKTSRKLMSVLALMAGTFAVQQAQAVPIMWTVKGVTFNDGGTIQGSFVFDEQTGQYSNIELISTDAALFSGASYGGDVPGYSNDSTFLRSQSNDAGSSGYYSVVTFLWASSLSDAGGVTAVLPGSEDSSYTHSSEGRRFGRRWTSDRYVTDGGTVSAVPEPATYLLIGIGIAGMMLKRRFAHG